MEREAQPTAKGLYVDDGCFPLAPPPPEGSGGGLAQGKALEGSPAMHASFPLAVYNRKGCLAVSLAPVASVNALSWMVKLHITPSRVLQVHSL